MYSLTRLIDVAKPDHDRIIGELRAVAAAAEPLRSVVASTLPGSRNGGDILVHLRFDTENQRDCAAREFTAALADPAVSRVNGVSYAGAPARRCNAPGAIYRVLLLRVHPAIPEPTVDQFERELCSMPRYLPAIRAWQLSRVTDTAGTTAWTHVFEQEFTDADAVTGSYLMHPIHWAVVDRWFDPETTDVIIRDRVCHSFCAVTAPILG